MKKAIACLLATSLVSVLSSSSALAIGPLVAARVICAPESVKGNLLATNRILSDLAKNELRDNTQFGKIVHEVGSLESPEDQIQMYMNLLQINGDEETVEFIGARQIDRKYILALSQNAQISEVQAAMVARKLQESLKGQLK